MTGDGEESAGAALALAAFQKLLQEVRRTCHGMRAHPPSLAGWREVNINPRVVLMSNVTTTESLSFRGIADETLAIPEITRLARGQILPVRYRPAVMDHCVVVARDPDPARVQQLSEEIARRRRT